MNFVAKINIVNEKLHIFQYLHDISKHYAHHFETILNQCEKVFSTNIEKSLLVINEKQLFIKMYKVKN